MITSTIVIEYRNTNGLTNKQVAKHFGLSETQVKGAITAYNAGKEVKLKTSEDETLQVLLARKAAIDAKIAEAVVKEKQDVIEEIKQKLKLYNIEKSEVFPSRSDKGKQLPVKYKNPATGQSWSGRGKNPLWLGDKDKELFKI